MVPDFGIDIGYPMESGTDGKIGIGESNHRVSVSIGTRSHPYHGIISGNWLKTADTTEDFSQFYPI
jgi:hypothetical protein